MARVLQPMTEPKMKVVEIKTGETYTLRTAVLRDNTPTSDPRYPEDTKSGTIHLGIYDTDELIGTSTWVINAWHQDPEAIAVQLRGMAVAKHKQGLGLGGLLLNAGLAHAERLNAKYLWAKARDTALAFYLRHEFVAVGDGFTEGITQMPHHFVVRKLTKR